MLEPGYKNCPYCAEPIREEAIKCRYCQTMLTQLAGIEDIPIPPSIATLTQQDQSAIQQLARYVPARVIDGILSGTQIADEGERRNITILFADLVGFTGLSESLDPEEVKDIMDVFLHELSEIITHYEGTVDKFIGDAVMALFGAPMAHDNDPERALRSGIEMQEACIRLSKQIGRKLQVRIGISCGDVIVGGLGGKHRLDYTAIGDVVNLANRIQTKAEPGQVIVSKRIFERTQSSFLFQSLGTVELKGKSDPVLIYLLNGKIREFDKIPLRQISSTKLIGRDSEMKLLGEAIETAKKGELVLFHVKGESGVGKSRLMYELRNKSAEWDVQFYYGRCLSYGKGSPYLPFVDLLIRGFCKISDTLSKEEAVKKVERVLKSISPELKDDIPYIQYLVSPEKVSIRVMEEDPKTRMQKIFGAVLRLIEKASLHKTIILEFEDLQWADELSLQLLTYLSTRIEKCRVLFFLVYRTHFDFNLSIPVGVNQKNLHLQELSDKDSELLIYHLLGMKQIPIELINKVKIKMEGNPFFGEEVVLYLIQTGTLEEEEQGWELTKELSKVEIPDSIQGVVLSRIDRLESSLKRVLQCASVIGQRFRYRLLDYVLEVEQELNKQLDKLVEGGLILEQSMIPELEYLFRQSITQEVTYNGLLLKRRKLFHGKIALCMEDIYQDRLSEYYEIIAYHYAMSDSHIKALEYLEKAGNKCRKLYANEAALEFYTDAIKRKQHYQGSVEQRKMQEISLRLHRGAVLELIGQGKQAIIDNLRSAVLSNQIGNYPFLINSYQNICELYRQFGQFNKAIEFGQKAFDLCRTNNNSSEELNCTNRLAVVYRDLGQYESALHYFQEVLNLSLQMKDEMLMANAHNNLGLTYWSMGKYEEAINHIRVALELRKELGDKKGQVAGFNNLGILYEKQGRLDESLSAYSQCVRLAREIGFKRGEVAGNTNIGWIYWLHGQHKEALETYHQGLAQAIKMGDIHAQAIIQCNTGYVCMFQNEYINALDCFQKGLELAVSTKDYYPQLVVLNGLLELYIRHKKLKEAGEISDKMNLLVKEFKDEENATTTYRLLSNLTLELGDIEKAEGYASQSYEFARRTGNLRELAWSGLSMAKIQIKKKNLSLAVDYMNKSTKIARQLNDIHCLSELKFLLP